MSMRPIYCRNCGESMSSGPFHDCGADPQVGVAILLDKDLEDLRAVAQAAMPLFDWWKQENFHDDLLNYWDQKHLDHIAAFSPEVVIAMLNRIQDLKNERDKLYERIDVLTSEQSVKEHPENCCSCHDEDCQENDLLRARIKELKRERDLALAHDTQEYPTAWAYEQVCKARDNWQRRAEDSERELSEWKAQWFGEFPPLAREDLKVRCWRCWDEAKARAFHRQGDSHGMTEEDWYVHLIRNEWCVKGAVR